MRFWWPRCQFVLFMLFTNFMFCLFIKVRSSPVFSHVLGFELTFVVFTSFAVPKVDQNEGEAQEVWINSVVLHLSFRLLLANQPCQEQRFSTFVHTFFFILSIYIFFPLVIQCLYLVQIVKQLWAYIRKNNLQDPSNKRKIICNDELRLVFEVDCTDMFQMNKLLSKHIIALDPTSMNTKFTDSLSYVLI